MSCAQELHAALSPCVDLRSTPAYRLAYPVETAFMFVRLDDEVPAPSSSAALSASPQAGLDPVFLLEPSAPSASTALVVAPPVLSAVFAPDDVMELLREAALPASDVALDLDADDAAAELLLALTDDDDISLDPASIPSFVQPGVALDAHDNEATKSYPADIEMLDLSTPDDYFEEEL